jgi:formiminotetrahydrofolate cyclodeaminase
MFVEEIEYFLVKLKADETFIKSLHDKYTGEEKENEQIVLKIVTLEKFEEMLNDGSCKDAKAFITMYQALPKINDTDDNIRDISKKQI